MNKKETLDLIRAIQKDIKNTMELLQYNINDLDEIRKTVILSMPDNARLETGWTKEDNQIFRGGKV